MMVQHHTKYIELHGVDEVVEMSMSEHNRLHHRLRKEGKCAVPPDELAKISRDAHQRSSKRKEYQREYRAENWDRDRAYQRAYYIEHREQKQAYYIEHRDQIMARRKAKKLEDTIR